MGKSFFMPSRGKMFLLKTYSGQKENYAGLNEASPRKISSNVLVCPVDVEKLFIFNMPFAMKRHFIAPILTVAFLILLPHSGVLAVTLDAALWTANVETGESTLVGNTTSSEGERSFQSIAFHPQNALYGVDGTNLWTIDILTGNSTFIAETSSSGSGRNLQSIAFHPWNALYGVTKSPSTEIPELSTFFLLGSGLLALLFKQRD